MSKVKSITPLPPADFTPELGNYKTLQPFRYWCQKVLPLVYDDSLSYYELLCKVVDYLNKTMEDVKTLHGDVTNLHTAYVQLQNYVNTYFSSLDVQQEINKKLDEMVNDGTLFATDSLNYNHRVLWKKPENLNKHEEIGKGAQGFDSDGKIFVMMYHLNDEAPIQMYVGELGTGVEVYNGTVKDKNGSPMSGHFNSVCLYNQKVYAVQNTHTLLALDLSGNLLETFNGFGALTAFCVRDLVYSAGYSNVKVAVSDDGGYGGFFVNLQNQGHDFFPVTQIATDIGWYIRNGLATNGYIVAQHAYKWDVDYMCSKIMFYSINGFHITDYILTGEYRSSEIEGVYIAPDASYILMSTLGGNIYKIETPDLKLYQKNTRVSPFGNNVNYNSYVFFDRDANIGNTINYRNKIVKEFEVLPHCGSALGNAIFSIIDDLTIQVSFQSEVYNVTIDTAIPRGATDNDRYIRALYTRKNVNGVETYRLSGIFCYSKSGQSVQHYGNFDSPVPDSILDKVIETITNISLKPVVLSLVPADTSTRIPKGVRVIE